MESRSRSPLISSLCTWGQVLLCVLSATAFRLILLWDLPPSMASQALLDLEQSTLA